MNTNTSDLQIYTLPPVMRQVSFGDSRTEFIYRKRFNEEVYNCLYEYLYNEALHYLENDTDTKTLAKVLVKQSEIFFSGQDCFYLYMIERLKQDLQECKHD